MQISLIAVSNTAAEVSLDTQQAYMAQWRSLDAKADISAVATITEAIESAKHFGCRYDGALTLVTGSLCLVGGALSILELENPK